MTRYDITADHLPLVAYVTKGLAAVAATELSTLTPAAPIERCDDRFLTCEADLALLDAWIAQARTVDDVRVMVAGPTKIRTREDLAALCDTAQRQIVALLGPDRRDEPWSVTVSAKNPAWTRGKDRWDPTEVFRSHLHGANPDSEERAPVDVRVQVDTDTTHLSVNVTSTPIGKRPSARYQGALRPTVAAAMVLLATHQRPDDIVTRGLFDPTCGSGTILLEARHRGLPIYGCDIEPDAVTLTRDRVGPTLGLAGDDLLTTLTHRIFTHDVLKPEDARTLKAPTVVANLPWGKQVPVGRRSELFSAAARLAAPRVADGGTAVFLTTHDEQCAAAIRRAIDTTVATHRIGLLGQTPAIVVAAGPQ